MERGGRGRGRLLLQVPGALLEGFVNARIGHLEGLGATAAKGASAVDGLAGDQAALKALRLYLWSPETARRISPSREAFLLDVSWIY